MSEIQTGSMLAYVREAGPASLRPSQGSGPARAVTRTGTPAPAGDRQASGAAQPEARRIEEAIRRMRERMPQRVAREVRFVVDRERERVVIEVVDRGTEQVIRRIPPEELLALADRMEELRGLLLRDRA